MEIEGRKWAKGVDFNAKLFVHFEVDLRHAYLIDHHKQKLRKKRAVNWQ
jgi:hypothetical protein